MEQDIRGVSPQGGHHTTDLPALEYHGLFGGGLWEKGVCRVSSGAYIEDDSGALRVYTEEGREEETAHFHISHDSPNSLRCPTH